MPSAPLRAGRAPAPDRRSDRPAGRHGSGAVRRGPDWSAVAAGRVVKAGVGLGLAAAVTTVLLDPGPSSAVPPLPGTAASGLAARAESGARVSRDGRRTTLRGVSVAAPLSPAPVAPQRVGLLPVTAVARADAAGSGPAAGPFSVVTYAAQGAALGLGAHAARVYSAVRTAFGITTIGGYRPGDSGDHGTGHAVDIMISSTAQGDAVAAFVQAHASEFHVTYVIWRQRIWFPGTSTWRPMADRGSITANHYDHVHVSVS